MSNDLISRSATYKELISSIDWLREQNYELYCAIGDSIRCGIDEMPTAYDVDKVIEEFDKKYNNTLWIKGDDEFSITRDEIIEIVKNGCVGKDV